MTGAERRFLVDRHARALAELRRLESARNAGVRGGHRPTGLDERLAAKQREVEEMARRLAEPAVYVGS